MAANALLSHNQQVKNQRQSASKMDGFCAILFAISIWLNQRDGKMLMLTLVVGIGISITVPDEGFYLYCIAGEILICALASIIKANASRAVFWLCALLVPIHFLAMHSKGFDDSDPYPYIVPLYEIAQLIACIYLSKPLITGTKNV